MYDALDDRFSRKVVRKAVFVDHGHGHGHGHDDLNHGEVKKKKTSKKQKKVVTHWNFLNLFIYQKSLKFIKKILSEFGKIKKIIK